MTLFSLHSVGSGLHHGMFGIRLSKAIGNQVLVAYGYAWNIVKQRCGQL